MVMMMMIMHKEIYFCISSDNKLINKLFNKLVRHMLDCGSTIRGSIHNQLRIIHANTGNAASQGRITRTVYTTTTVYNNIKLLMTIAHIF
jgi:hypothetical protein